MKLLLSIGTLMLIAGLSGCGTDPSSSLSSSSITTPTTSQSSTTTNGVTSCVANDLKAEEVTTAAGAGQRYATIALKNTSPTSCQIAGYPGMAIGNASGILISNVTRTPGVVDAINLDAGANAYFDVHYSVIPTNNEECSDVTQFDITPPDDTQQVTLDVGDISTLCKGSGVSVTPVRASVTFSQ